MPLMTKVEYAKSKGVSKSYLSSKAMKERLEPAMERDERGKWKINSDKADEIFLMTQDPARAHVRKRDIQDISLQNADIGGFELKGYEKSRAEREEIKVEQARLDLMERKGKTLERKSVMEACTASGQIIREHLKAAGRRIAEKAATMTDARAIKSMFDEEMRTAMEIASDDFRRRLPSTESEGRGSITIN